MAAPAPPFYRLSCQECCSRRGQERHYGDCPVFGQRQWGERSDFQVCDDDDIWHIRLFAVNTGRVAVRVIRVYAPHDALGLLRLFLAIVFRNFVSVNVIPRGKDRRGGQQKPQQQ